MEAEVEIEALRSIFGDEINVEKDHDRSVTVVRRKVRPNDEGGVSSASIVVEFELSMEYPDVSPKVHLLNPRGLSEESHQQLIDDIQQRLSENVGMPIIFDVLQYCADFILEHQHSSSLLCPICLCPMPVASVSVTPCDHFTHTECFEKHTEYTRKQLGEKLLARDFKMCNDIDRSLRCPVCREVVENEIEPILESSTPNKRKGKRSSKNGADTDSYSLESPDTEFEFDWQKWREQQASLMKIYERQKEKGGIIDLEEERKKNLVTEDTVVVIANEMDGVLMEDPAATGLEQLSTQPLIGDLDVPPGFENAIPTTSVPAKSEPEHHRRGRGRGGRCYGWRPHERGYRDYRSTHWKEFSDKSVPFRQGRGSHHGGSFTSGGGQSRPEPHRNENLSKINKSAPLEPSAPNAEPVSSVEGQGCPDTKRGEKFPRGRGPPRNYPHSHQRGRNWKERAPRERVERDSQLQPKIE